MVSAQSLNGLRVLNTRPEQQAMPLADAIEDAGGLSINLPVITIEPTETTWIHALPALENFQCAIFTSPNAVHSFFSEISSNSWPSSINLLALGQGTAKALTQRGLPHPTIPKQADSEHLLMLDALHNLKNQTILLIKGEGGRTLISTSLTAQGARVSTLEVYRRTQTHFDKKRIQTLWHENAVDIILITSETALAYLFALFGEQARPWLCRKPYLVISERLHKVVQAEGIQTVMVSPYENIITTLLDYTAHKKL